MILEKILLETKFIKDDTEVWVRDSEMRVLAHGNWYQDDILEYACRELECFTWQDDNNIYLDLK